MAPPKGARNALTNGSRMSVYRLISGELPKPMRRIRTAARKYKRDLEDAVIAKHGTVSLTDAHTLDAACGYETLGGICRWLLCHRMDQMSVSDIILAAKNIANAKESRNRCLKQLRVDDDADLLRADVVYTAAALPADTSDDQDDDDASGDAECDVASILPDGVKCGSVADLASDVEGDSGDDDAGDNDTDAGDHDPDDVDHDDAGTAPDASDAPLWDEASDDDRGTEG